MKYLLNLFTSVLNAGSVPQKWRDASLVPLPKKGDLYLLRLSTEHGTKAFLQLFVDLRIAYNSVPRDAMWLIVNKLMNLKYGVPKKLANLIRFFHENMQAGSSVGDSAHVMVSNGLRQGCVLAQTLFTLLFNMVIQCWYVCCQQLGVKLYCISLVGILSTRAELKYPCHPG